MKIVPFAEGQVVANWIPLENHIGLISNDLREVRHHMSEHVFPHDLKPLGPCEIVFRHHFAALGELAFSYTDYGAPVGDLKIFAPSMNDMFAITLTLGGTAEVVHARDRLTMRTGDLLLIEPGAPFTLNMSGDFRPLTLWMGRSALERAVSNELGFALTDPLKFEGGPLIGPSQTAQIVRAMVSICEDLGSREPGLTLPRVSKHAEMLLLSMLISLIPHNYSAALGAETSEAAPYYVKRVIRYVSDNLRNDIAFSDLVEASGVSARSLHSAFQRFVGHPPMAFVKSMRLDLARLELIQSEGRDVTGIAFDCGFSQLSKFAADYKKRFGISPSQTRSSHGL